MILQKKEIKEKAAMRQYSNFNEIDRDLKLLKLQQDIAKEEISLNVNRTKESLKPMAIVKTLAGTVLKSAMVFKTVNKLLSVITKKKA